MEISYVQPGEKITAQGYNALVDAVGGAGNAVSDVGDAARDALQ